MDNFNGKLQYIEHDTDGYGCGSNAEAFHKLPSEMAARAHGGMGTIIDDHFLCSPKTNGVDGLLPGRAAGFINNNTEKHVNTHRTDRTVWPVRTAVCLAGGPSVCLSATH